MRKERFYLDFIIKPPLFDFNNETILEICFSAENIAWVSTKGNKYVSRENFPKLLRKEFLDELSMLFTDALMWILENQGESAFRNAAKFLYLSEKQINENLKIWRKDKNATKSNNRR